MKIFAGLIELQMEQKGLVFEKDFPEIDEAPDLGSRNNVPFMKGTKGYIEWRGWRAERDLNAKPKHGRAAPGSERKISGT
ncbi:MAG TPA: hypothetical protein VN944_03220, partial [Nitrospiria bacterium]|nr:hypothetical protein [Nitrospiria bacterium]